MAKKVFMPRLTHDMRSGVFTQWLKEEGEFVKSDEPLFEVETDKAVTEVLASSDGILAGVRCKTGDEIPIGATIAFLLVNAEEALPESEAEPVAFETASALQVEAVHLEKNLDQVSSHKPTELIIASPLARRMARVEGINLEEVTGSGPRGRIIEGDIRSYLNRAAAQAQKAIPTVPSVSRLEPPQPTSHPAISQLDIPFERMPLTRFQRITGERMLYSVQHAPQFVLEVDVDMSEAVRCRDRYLVESGKKVSYTALLIQATAQALVKTPRINAQFNGVEVFCYTQANVGVAITTTSGLLVPVIHAAEKLRLFELQAELERLKQEAENGLLKAQQLTGSTVTVSNLGMYGIDRFQAIVNPPETGILAAGRIRLIPMAVADGVEVRPIMTLKLSADHRIVDGTTAAPFLVEVKQILENPYLLL